MKLTFALALLSLAVAKETRFRNEIVISPDTVHHSHTKPLPHTYLDAAHLPDSFDWSDVNGRSYLTHSLNQHVPQYCGSCWAHGALSSLADRIKIARGGVGDDINLSIQFILNCGTEQAGSCHGGYHTSTYQFIQDYGQVPYDTCMPYMACSEESTEGICEHVDTTCSASNICRTCDTFAGMGGECTYIDSYPNATIAEYGMTPPLVSAIQSEIFVRGPVAATVNAEPLVHYTGGVYKDDSESQQTNHIVSITGWGTDEEDGTLYWIVRNSWGQYWGEFGFFRIAAGQNLLGIEGEIAWATPGTFTIHNYPCAENGDGCNGNEQKKQFMNHHYVDPSEMDVMELLAMRLPAVEENNPVVEEVAVAEM